MPTRPITGKQCSFSWTVLLFLSAQATVELSLENEKDRNNVCHYAGSRTFLICRLDAEHFSRYFQKTKMASAIQLTDIETPYT